MSLQQATADRQHDGLSRAVLVPSDDAGTHEPDGYAAAQAFLIENDVRAVDCIVVDTWGIPRGKRLPVAAFLEDRGMSIGKAIFASEVDAALDDNPWIGTSSGYPDMRAVPDLQTLRIAGWGERLATVMCDCVYVGSGDAIPLDARSMVKRTLKQFGELELRVDLAAELEFYLYDRNWQLVSQEIGLFNLTALQDVDQVVGPIVEALMATGIEVESSSAEYSPGHFEITQRYDEALAALDKTVLFKHVVRQTARRLGYNVSFMAKPTAAAGGSGMHVHLSLVEDGGRNLFGVVDDDHPLGSTVMRRFTAGLLRHQRELQAVTHPTINDYKRSTDHSFAPNRVTWGIDNRSAGVRCLPRIGSASRLEVRWASAAAHPYLVAQGYLQAGLDGLRHEIPLIDQCIGDAYADPRWERIADRPEDAIARFEASPFAQGAYGDAFVETFCAMQRKELQRFSEHVTDWELARYRGRL
jgi:glutamine synthetase